MSRKPEQRLNDRIRDNVARIGARDIILERIENSLRAGTPDTIVLAKRTRRVTWAEHKVAAWPKRPGSPIQFKHPPTIDQLNFHLRWNQGRGHTLFIVGMVDEFDKVTPNGSVLVWDGKDGDNVKEITADTARRGLKTYEELVDIYVRGFR